MIESWLSAYSPEKGGKRPLILDGGLELDQLSNTTFRELDFDIGIKTQEKAILTALGIPETDNSIRFENNLRSESVEENLKRFLSESLGRSVTNVRSGGGSTRTINKSN